MRRILGLDFGLRRIGAALGDPRGLIATPHEVYERRSQALDSAHFNRLVEDYEIDRIVVGLPLHTTGSEGDLARKAREFGAWLGQVTGCAVQYFDERYTSREADESMRAGGLKASQRKARRDMLAAQILLQAFLDAGCPTADSPTMPLADPAEGSDES